MNKRILCLLMAGMLVLGSGLNVIATSISSVQKNQSETKNKLNEVNKSITTIENKRKEVQSQINNLNADLVDTILTLEVLEGDLIEKQKEIDAAQAEYEKYLALEEEQYEDMKLRIQYMYESDDMDYFTMLLEAESISDLLNRADFVQEVSDYDQKKLTEYQETKDMVAETKAVLEEERAELEEVQEAEQEYKAELDRKISSARSKVKNFDAELANAQAKAKEYQKTIKEQTAIIQKLQEEENKKNESSESGSSNQESADSSGNSDTDTGSGGDSDSGGGSDSGSNSGSDSSSGSSGGSDSSDSGSSGNSGLGSSIASYALQFVGNPYVSGGTSLTHGADCSGFTWAVHRHFGISIPRVSSAQANGGKPVSLGSIQPGDILYYGGHVGIYIGGGKIVHASTPSTGIKISSYTYRPLICARRYW